MFNALLPRNNSKALVDRPEGGDLAYKGYAIAGSGRLPAATRQRLKELIGATDEAHADYLARHQAAQIADGKHSKALNDLHAFARAAGVKPDGDGKKSEDHWRYIHKRDQAAEVMATAEARLEKAATESVRLRTILSRLEDDLKAWSDQARAITECAPVEPGKTTIAAARYRIEMIRSEIHRVSSAPRPKAEVLEDIDRYLARVAELAEPEVERLLEGSREVQWPARTLDRQGIRELDAVAALIVWAVPELVRKRFVEAIDRYASEEDALAAPERRKQLAKLEADLLAAERIEVACCLRDSEPIRQDIDVRALLNIEVAP